jgi:hypothetical protein
MQALKLENKIKIKIKIKIEIKLSPVLPLTGAPRHEGVLGSGGTAPPIL